MDFIGKFFALVSKPGQEKPGSPENGMRMMKELQTKLEAKVITCDRCGCRLTDQEARNPRIIINFFENWLLCRNCR